jgi:osmotically-inducible protein OsmY
MIVADLSKTKTITNARDSRLRPRPEVAGSTRPAAWITALLLTGALSACAEYQPYEKCAKGGCAGDANITANVEGFDQLYVKTMDHVVYLSGTVETGLHRDIAASVVREVNGVSSIVNNIAVDK